jgi:hypothetical protein
MALRLPVKRLLMAQKPPVRESSMALKRLALNWA